MRSRCPILLDELLNPSAKFAWWSLRLTIPTSLGFIALFWILHGQPWTGAAFGSIFVLVLGSVSGPIMASEFRSKRRLTAFQRESIRAALVGGIWAAAWIAPLLLVIYFRHGKFPSLADSAGIVVGWGAVCFLVALAPTRDS
jgi:Flp pilus assembly protein TadB